MAHDGYPATGWGGKLSAEETDYYVVAVPKEAREAAVLTLAICSRCGAPVYDNETHDEFHAEQEKIKVTVETLRAYADKPN